MQLCTVSSSHQLCSMHHMALLHIQHRQSCFVQGPRHTSFVPCMTQDCLTVIACKVALRKVYILPALYHALLGIAWGWLLSRRLCAVSSSHQLCSMHHTVLLESHHLQGGFAQGLHHSHSVARITRHWCEASAFKTAFCNCYMTPGLPRLQMHSCKECQSDIWLCGT